MTVEDLTMYDRRALRFRVHTEKGAPSVTTFTIGGDGQMTAELADQRVFALAVNLLQRVQQSMPFDKLAAALALLEAVPTE